MASLFTLSRHLARDLVADELSPSLRHSLWQQLCQHAANLAPSAASVPSPHEPHLQCWLLEKGPARC